MHRWAFKKKKSNKWSCAYCFVCYVPLLSFGCVRGYLYFQFLKRWVQERKVVKWSCVLGFMARCCIRFTHRLSVCIFSSRTVVLTELESLFWLQTGVSDRVSILLPWKVSLSYWLSDVEKIYMGVELVDACTYLLETLYWVVRSCFSVAEFCDHSARMCLVM